MRTIVVILAVAFYSVTGLTKSKPSLLLEVKLTGHYRVQETAIYGSAGIWICKTELIPYFESKKSPIDDELLRRFSVGNQGAKKKCRDAIKITDHSEGRPRLITGCRSDPQFAKFMDQLDGACGR